MVGSIELDFEQIEQSYEQRGALALETPKSEGVVVMVTGASNRSWLNHSRGHLSATLKTAVDKIWSGYRKQVCLIETGTREI